VPRTGGRVRYIYGVLVSLLIRPNSYWSAAALTLEPRLSSKWLANIAFFGTIISLPVPSSSFLLTEDSRTGSYQPTPPPLHTILENILPSVNTKSNFSKGLQSPSGLVQHCTALALTKCLMKYDQVLQTFRGVAAELEEDEEEGEWFKRIRDLEKEVRRRVPEFQVVVAFSQHGLVLDIAAAANPQSKGQPVTANATRSSLLAESALRLLWMYNRCLASLAAEARFDIGKLLQRFLKVPSGDDDEEEEEEIEVPDTVERLDRVRRLHVLRLLKESDQFTWTGKLSGTKYLYIHGIRI
jgi:nucleolar pre-ribosomal-associated protein 1